MVIIDVWHSRDDFQKMLDDPEFRKKLHKLGCGPQSHTSLGSRRYTLASPKATSHLLQQRARRLAEVTSLTSENPIKAK
jgi:hypothetical protein